MRAIGFVRLAASIVLIFTVAQERPLCQSMSPISEPYLPEAERTFRSAVEFHPDSPVAHYWLGVTYMQVHKGAEAERTLLNGLRLRPNFSEAYNALGILYDEQELYSKSEVAFSQALAHN